MTRDNRAPDRRTSAATAPRRSRRRRSTDRGVVRLPAGYAIAFFLLPVLILSGCAVGPLTNQVSRVEDDNNGITSHENVGVDDDARADFDAAMNYLRAGEYDKGTDLLSRMTQRSPAHAAPYINLAIAYQKMGKLPAAEASVKKALELAPEHPVANNEYGLICRKTGRFAEARAIYERTLKSYPGFLPARKNLGILCDMYLRDPECALRHYRIYSTAVPDDKTVPIWIADLEKRLGTQRH